MADVKIFSLGGFIWSPVNIFERGVNKVLTEETPLLQFFFSFLKRFPSYFYINELWPRTTSPLIPFICWNLYPLIFSCKQSPEQGPQSGETMQVWFLAWSEKRASTGCWYVAQGFVSTSCHQSLTAHHLQVDRKTAAFCGSSGSVPVESGIKSNSGSVF